MRMDIQRSTVTSEFGTTSHLMYTLGNVSRNGYVYTYYNWNTHIVSDKYIIMGIYILNNREVDLYEYGKQLPMIVLK